MTPCNYWKKKASELNTPTQKYLDDSLRLLKEKEWTQYPNTETYCTLMTPCNIGRKKQMNSLLQHRNLPWRLPAATQRKRMNSMPQHKNVLYLDDSQQLLEERTIEHTVLTQKFTLTTPCNYSKKNNELSAPLQKCTVPWWLPTTTERKKIKLTALTQRNLPWRLPAATQRKRMNSMSNTQTYCTLMTPCNYWKKKNWTHYSNTETYLDDSLQLLKERTIEITALIQKLIVPWRFPVE